MSEPRDYCGYPCKPRQIKPPQAPDAHEVWYYEQISGLDVHVEVRPTLPTTTHIAFQISWRRVEAALRNRDRALKDKKDKKDN